MRKLFGIILILTVYLYSDVNNTKINKIEEKELEQKVIFEQELENKKKRQEKLKLEIEKLKQSLYEEKLENK